MQANVSLWDVPLSFSPTETIPMNDNISEIDRITLRESPEREPIDEVNFVQPIPLVYAQRGHL